jgi:hypothetical protein
MNDPDTDSKEQIQPDPIALYEEDNRHIKLSRTSPLRIQSQFNQSRTFSKLADK